MALFIKQLTKETRGMLCEWKWYITNLGEDPDTIPYSFVFILTSPVRAQSERLEGQDNVIGHIW